MRCSLRQWATAVGGGAVRAERGRAAGDLHDPLHAGGDGGVDRRGLAQVLVGPVGGEQQQPLDAVEGRRAASPARSGRRAPRAAASARSGRRTSARASTPRSARPAATWRPTRPVAPRTPIMPPPPRARRAAIRRHARAPARTSSAPPQANTKRSGRSSAQRQAAAAQPVAVGARLGDREALGLEQRRASGRRSPRRPSPGRGGRRGGRSGGTASRRSGAWRAAPAWSRRRRRRRSGAA